MSDSSDHISHKQNLPDELKTATIRNGDERWDQSKQATHFAEAFAPGFKSEVHKKTESRKSRWVWCSNKTVIEP